MGYGTAFAAVSTVLTLTLENLPTSGIATNDVWLMVIGNDPVHHTHPVYLDLEYNELRPFSPNPNEMGLRMSDLPTSNGNFILDIPSINSGRVYFFLKKLPAQMAPSGPSFSGETNIVFDKLEFDTSTLNDVNVNPTSVDFYGFSYTVSNGEKTIGFTTCRQKVIAALAELNGSEVMNHTILRGQAEIDDSDSIGKKSQQSESFQETQPMNPVLRVLAPKSMAFPQWAYKPIGPHFPTAYANWHTVTHFFNTYVKKVALYEGREFTYLSKLWDPGMSPAQREEHRLYAKVENGKVHVSDKDGNPRALLQLPFNDPPNPPSDQKYYHNNVDADPDLIDWGFVLMGNDGGSTSTSAAYNWTTDIRPEGIPILLSICRGVAHLDNAVNSDGNWTNPKLFYFPESDVSTAENPILYYARALHQVALDNKIYALSLDDTYKQEAKINPLQNKDRTYSLSYTIQSATEVTDVTKLTC